MQIQLKAFSNLNRGKRQKWMVFFDIPNDAHSTSTGEFVALLLLIERDTTSHDTFPCQSQDFVPAVMFYRVELRWLSINGLCLRLFPSAARAICIPALCFLWSHSRRAKSGNASITVWYPAWCYWLRHHSWISPALFILKLWFILLLFFFY